MSLSRRAALAGVVGVAALGLAGCATAPPIPADAAVLSGRLAVRVAADGAQPARAFSAGFELRGAGPAGELRLDSPLGLTLASARWTPAGAWLRTSEGERSFADLDALSVAALGEPLPLQALSDWLRGQPWPGAPSRVASGGFEQLGWRIDLNGLGDGRVDALRDAPPQVSVRVRLADPR